MPLKYPDKPIVIHFYDRRNLQGNEQDHIPGGATVCYMPSNSKMGFAICNVNDPFNSERGRLIAQNRAAFTENRVGKQARRFSHSINLPSADIDSWEDVRDEAISHLRQIAASVGNTNLSNILQLQELVRTPR